MIDVGRELGLAARRHLKGERGHHPVREFLCGDGFAIGCGVVLIALVVALIGAAL